MKEKKKKCLTAVMAAPIVPVMSPTMPVETELRAIWISNELPGDAMVALNSIGGEAFSPPVNVSPIQQGSEVAITLDS